MDTNIKVMLDRYHCQNAMEYEQALKEIIQETAMSGLARSGFFKEAAFTGGTALRIFYGLPRFSEDLDFSLLSPNPEFVLSKFLPTVKAELLSVGFEMEVQNKSHHAGSAIQSAFLKENTLKILLQFTSLKPPVSGIHANAVIRIKLEIDTNPPAGAHYEEKASFLPNPYIARLMDAPSLLATKLHAILARSFNKGRDYYDYVFYLQRQIPVNLILLGNALRQTGHLTSEVILDLPALRSMLAAKFASIDFQAMKSDVLPFVKDSSELSFWSETLFTASLERLSVM